MRLILNPRKDFPRNGPCLQLHGEYVTEKVWGIVRHFMCNNLMNSAEYKLRTEANAFFQGGSDKPGDWILIEFWSKNDSAIQECVDLISAQVRTVIVYEKTIIRPDLYNMEWGDGKGSLNLCVEIAKEVGCQYETSNSGPPFRFIPENNVQYSKIISLCREFGIPTNWNI